MSEDEGKTGWDDPTGRRLVAQKIRATRKARGLSQQELAFAADTHRTHLVRFEAGTVNLTLDAFFALAAALDVEPKELIPTRDEIEQARRDRGEV